jgi:hypothetical protein
MYGHTTVPQFEFIKILYFISVYTVFDMDVTFILWDFFSSPLRPDRL